MQQYRCYGDDRNKGFCVHCGGPDETIDHVPSKVFLDEPYPENLMAAPSCRKCNTSFSLDEEYLACFLECVLAGVADHEKTHRSKIARILRGNASLQARLQNARSEVDGTPIWNPEFERIQRVILKLARCHAAFELNEPMLEAPAHLAIKPLSLMTADQLSSFEDHGSPVIWPEVGSRAMQRVLVSGMDLHAEGWLVVQENNYRFQVHQACGLTIKIVLREYLGCEIVWD